MSDRDRSPNGCGLKDRVQFEAETPLVDAASEAVLSALNDNGRG